VNFPFVIDSTYRAGLFFFCLAGLAKQSRIGRLPKPIEFKEFPDHLLCPVKCLQRYESVTSTFRKKPGHNHLFLGIISPQSPVVSSTIAGSLKNVLSSSGTTKHFLTAHSTRGASSSAASTGGITTQQILITAVWSTASTFRHFYLRDKEVQSRQGFEVLSFLASKSRYDMEPEPSEVQSGNG